MHSLMLITLTMLPAETSQNARERAYSLLLEDRSFCGDCGRFGSPLCDWFVIGGRWSGCLRKALMGQTYRDALKERFPELTGGRYSTRAVEAHGSALDALWREFGGTGPSPYNRDDYRNTGYDDDALLVDQALHDRLLAEYTGESDVGEGTGEARFADLDNEAVDDTFIGRKWIAVVDYHS